MSFWENYNKSLLVNAKEILQYNEDNIFNYSEGRFYNHVRDLLAIVLSASSMQVSHNTKLKILDFGSNPIVWSNLQNKIAINNLDVTIFDPFSKKGDYKDLKFKFKMRVVNSISDLIGNDFDMSILGSVIQYIPHFLKDLENMQFLLNKKIFISHTPLSLKGVIQTKQLNMPNHHSEHTLHDFFQLTKVFKKLGYSQSFKSILDPLEASVQKKYLDRIIYANILFEKKES